MRLKKVTNVMIAVLAMAAFSSCDDNDDKGGGNSVFSGRKLASYTEIWRAGDNGGEKTTFHWSGDNIVKITDDDGDEMIISRNGSSATIKWSEELAPAKAKLNSNGFIETWESLEVWDDVYSGGKYNYDSNGRLTAYTDAGGTTGKISYNSDGDIVSATVDGRKTSLSYGSEPIPNKGGIMMMSEWGIMWDWEYFYWFGLYGKATAHLPVKSISHDETRTYEWTLDGQGYPTKCDITISSDYEDRSATMTFQWQ